MSVENNAENLFLITEQHLRGKIIKNEKLNTEILTENKTHVLGQPNNNDQQQHQHQQIGNNNNFNDNNEIYVDGNDVEELHKKLNKMCRFCLSEDENLRLIFDEYNCISDMFFVFASIQLTQNDGLPEKICFDCLTQLTKCVSFKQQVETAEAVLKHFIEEGYKSGMTLEKIESDNLEKYAEIHSNQFNLEFIGDNNDEFTEQDFNETEYYEDYDIDESQTFSPIQAELCIEMPPENDNNNTIRMDTEKPQILSTAKIKITDQNILPNTDDNLHKNLKPNEIQCPNKDKNNSEEIINQQNDEIKSLNCSFCKKDFKSYSSLARHVKLHIKEKIEIDNYLCNICNITFENLTKKDFQDHIRSHSTNSAVTTTSTTTITTRTIKDDGNKRKLNENSSKKTSFKCEECKVQFIVKTDLYIHGAIHLKPNENGQFICRKCDKIFTDIGKLKRHVRIHFEDKPYKCESCGRGFPEMCSLKRHFRKNHSGRKKERKFICKICDKKYYEAYALMVHTRTHTEEKPYICTECNRCFTDIRLLNSHRKTHLGLRIHACKHCDKKFTHQSTLTTHLRTHTGEKPYACVICNKYFIQSSNLRLHMRVHSGERPYNCDICTKAFASSSALTTHKRTHTGEKPYSCSQCNKSFTRSDLSAHMLTHTKERPFSCTICKKSFTTASQLKVHNRTSHTDEKPYICEICNEQWPSFVYLKKHLLTHKNGDQKNDRTKDLEKIENDNKNITMDNANNSNRNNINNNNISDNNNIGFLGEDNDDAEMNESICLVNDLLAAVAQSDLNTNLL